MTEKRDTAISDEALAARAKEEAWAQERLLERYKPLVRAQAASYYLPGADAEDLVQEGMIGLFRAIQDFDPAKGAFGSFAKLCVQRQVISAVKASTRQKHQLLNEFVSFDARTDESAPRCRARWHRFLSSLSSQTVLDKAPSSARHDRGLFVTSRHNHGARSFACLQGVSRPNNRKVHQHG